MSDTQVDPPAPDQTGPDQAGPDQTGRDQAGSGPAAPTLGIGNPDVVRAIEAVVMVSAEPVESAALANLLDITDETVDDLCRRLARAYDEAGAGFQLVKVAGGWRYQSHPDLAPYVERHVLEGQTARLSAAALETLAIVAYKQPISRAQIASIRGVDPDGVLRTLQARGYVDQIGRDPGPGQAMLWGTTSLFLDKLGLDSLADLPPLAEFVPGADVVEALEQGLRITPTTAVAAEVPAPTVASTPVAADDTAPATPDDTTPDDTTPDEADEREPVEAESDDAEPDEAEGGPGSSADEVARPGDRPGVVEG